MDACAVVRKPFTETVETLRGQGLRLRGGWLGLRRAVQAAPEVLDSARYKCGHTTCFRGRVFLRVCVSEDVWILARSGLMLRRQLPQAV